MTKRKVLGCNKSLVAVAVALALVAVPSIALGANNQGTGDVAGDTDLLVNSNVFTLNLTTLTLVKTAFLTDGTQLAHDANIPKGSLVQFMIYFDNDTPVPVNNVNVQDILDVAFTYQSGTIRVSNTEDTGATEADIYSNVSTALLLDDGVDGTDVAGISGTTISAGSGTGNVQLDVAANKVWAILFTVQM